MPMETPVFRSIDDQGSLVPDLEYLDGLRRRLGVKDKLELQATQGKYNLCDTPGATVSLLNLQTVEALCEFAGTQISPLRFRMALWVSKLPAFEELTWADKYPGTKIIEIGDLRFSVLDACERCHAVNANPRTGQYDSQLQIQISAMMKQRGYKSPQRGTENVMGILLVPLDGGKLKRGAPVNFIG